MSTTQKAIRRQALMMPAGLGETRVPASYGAQTAVVTAFATGGFSAQRFIDRFMLRAEATSAADRLRRITDYSDSTGTLTQAGAAYVDQVATSEFLELHEREPFLLETGIQETLRRLKRRYRSIVPAINGVSRYWMGDKFDWIEKPSDILDLAWQASPVVSQNRHFQDYSTYNTSGVLQPDFWTLAGSGGTMARSTTQFRRPRANSLALTRAGTDLTLSQEVGLLESDVSGDSLRGQTIGFAGWAWSAVASQGRFFVNDGVTTTRTSFHTGASTWQELTTTKAVSASATQLTVGFEVNTSNTVCYVDECYLSTEGAISDGTRRDAQDEWRLNYNERWFDQQWLTPVGVLPKIGRGGRYVVYSKRGYPPFDDTRYKSSTADADISDAPLVTVACGAIARVYQALHTMEEAPAQGKFYQLWQEWDRQFVALAQSHLQVRNDDGFGLRLPTVMRAPAATRWS